MGFYHGSATPPEEKEPSGCWDALLLTRAVFGVLFWPLVILIGTVLGLIVLIYLFSVSWVLGLLGLILAGAGVVAYARWERGHFQGPGSP